MSSFHPSLATDLARALEARGFEALTPVQTAVLELAHEGRDLRISSQTGSGKTVAIGLALQDVLKSEEDDAETMEIEAAGRPSGPRAVVVAPTRELAKQVEEELRWLYAPRGMRVQSVTGGGGYREELAGLRSGPAIVVGTPGRMLDHLKRGSLAAAGVRAVVLDEADRMLDMGFREDLEAIFGYLSDDRRTHLVSATFPREVKVLADRIQQDPVRIEGTPHGAANADIDHRIHLVRREERLSAIVNLLLATAGAPTLIFVRTRADVSDLAFALEDAGFFVAALSGEMEQAERNRALAAFKRGRLDALVATDVAARGIDVQDIARVIHAEPPGDADTYTHRSGRTGRAGKKGTSSLLVVPLELPKVIRLLERAKVGYAFEPVPSAATIQEAIDQRLLDELTADDESSEPGDRAWRLARRIVESGQPTRALARLLARHRSSGGAQPRELTLIEPPVVRSGLPRDRVRPSRERFPRRDRGEEASEARGARGPRESGPWVAFRISWGQTHGADARRVLPMVCRRGGIAGHDVGAIRVFPTYSIVEVRGGVADTFEKGARHPDPKDPRITIRRWRDDGPSSPKPPRSKRDVNADSSRDAGDRRVSRSTVHAVSGRGGARSKLPTRPEKRSSSDARPKGKRRG